MSINMYLVMKYKGTFWNLHFEFGYTKKFFDKVSLLVKNDYLKISMLAQMKMPTKTIALKYSATQNGSALCVWNFEGKATHAQPIHQIRQIFGRFGGLAGPV